ncbi:MAG: succinate dehydrogenase, hydrophobic membrane anchor protein [Pseudomonadota bacterium]
MSHKPTSSFVMQRTSAVVLIPLALWFLWSLVSHAGDDFAGTQAWLSQWHNKAAFGLLVTIGVFHGRLGLNEIVEDYIHTGLNSVLKNTIILAGAAIVALTWFALLTV